jgi:uncharacterized protein YndB with AHSA1/START domain
MTVNKPVPEVYRVITEHISDWWSRDLTGTSAHPGDSFTIAFGKTRKTFEIVEAIPGKVVIWKCIKAHIDMPSLKNKAEWTGTRMIWTLNTADKETTITFMHQGLNKGLECYDICEAGWDEFLSSFQDYLATGNGRPYLKKVVDKKVNV